MKILYDYQIFAQHPFGGIARYFYELATRMPRLADCEIEIFAPLYLNKYFNAESKPRPRGLCIPRIPKTGRAVRFLNDIATRTIVQRRADVDIFHETYYATADNCPRTAKRVVTVYDMIHEKFSSYFPLDDQTAQRKAFAVKRADHVICISESTKRDLVELLNVAEGRCSVVYLGCGLAIPDDSPVRECRREPRILYVGKRDGYKNFVNLLRAFAIGGFAKQGLRLTCFGGGDLTISEKKLMCSLGLRESDVHVVFGSDEVLASLYVNSAMLVYPSLYEGFGIPPLEAMALGCPVVCARAGSLPEVVGSAAEMFDPTDIDDIVAAMERVLTATDGAAAIAEAGRDRARQFSWAKCARQTYEVYRELL